MTIGVKITVQKRLGMFQIYMYGACHLRFQECVVTIATDFNYQTECERWGE